MGTSVSQKISILCIKYRIWIQRSFNNAARQVATVDILLTRGKHLHDDTISLREESWTNKTIKTSLTQPL